MKYTSIQSQPSPQNIFPHSRKHPRLPLTPTATAIAVESDGPGHPTITVMGDDVGLVGGEAPTAKHPGIDLLAFQERMIGEGGSEVTLTCC